MRTAWVSIRGLRLLNPHLYDDFFLPEGVNKDHLVCQLESELAELEVLYPDERYMQSLIASWSASNLTNWTKLADALVAKYDPLHNYDRTETWDTTTKNKETREREETAKSASDTDFSGSSTVVEDGSSHESVNAYNKDTEDGMTPKSKTVQGGNTYNTNSSKTGGTSSETRGDNETTQTEDTEQRTGRAYGNIGVTTSQAMLREEILLRSSVNIYDVIIQAFKTRFCLMVY